MAKKKAPSVEDEFEAIAQRAIEEADAVKCSYEDYVEGLHSIVSSLHDLWNFARSELERKQKAQDREEE